MRPKEKCEKCGNVFQKCKLRKHKITKELWCKQCINKYGENKFNFNSKIPFKENNKISKFRITHNEKKMLVKSLQNQGVDYKDAWRRVNSNSRALSRMKIVYFNKKKEEAIKESFEKKRKLELNKAFLQGIGQ